MRAELIEELPARITQDDEDYQNIIANLRQQIRAEEEAFNSRFSDMVEYYTVWAHQIKTPIASMRLALGEEDSPLSRAISGDLSRSSNMLNGTLLSAAGQ